MVHDSLKDAMDHLCGRVLLSFKLLVLPTRGADLSLGTVAEHFTALTQQSCGRTRHFLSSLRNSWVAGEGPSAYNVEAIYLVVLLRAWYDHPEQKE